ncbi:MAG: hypothetical protein ACRDD7_06335 [Peptostreptococcaceae bacterium]
MSWEYRLVKRNYTDYGELVEITEVYYDDKGNIEGYGEAPVPYGETKEEVKECLDLMYKALEKEIIMR